MVEKRVTIVREHEVVFILGASELPRRQPRQQIIDNSHYRS